MSPGVGHEFQDAQLDHRVGHDRRAVHLHARRMAAGDVAEGHGRAEIDAARRQQRTSYKGLAAVDELERARARCMILLETAATGAFHKAAEDNADIGTRQAYVNLALRCLDGLNKMSDRFERARGQAQQQIFVQHNRFDNGSQAVLQTVQTERVESRSGPSPLSKCAQPADGETSSDLEESPPPYSAKRRKRGVGATP